MRELARELATHVGVAPRRKRPARRQAPSGGGGGSAGRRRGRRGGGGNARARGVDEAMAAQPREVARQYVREWQRRVDRRLRDRSELEIERSRGERGEERIRRQRWCESDDVLMRNEEKMGHGSSERVLRHSIMGDARALHRSMMRASIENGVSVGLSVGRTYALNSSTTAQPPSAPPPSAPPPPL